MGILSLLLTLCIAGFVLWMVNTYVPMPAVFKTVLNFVVIMLLIIFILDVFGLLGTGLPGRF